MLKKQIQFGFTLLEILIAVALLSMGLVVLIDSQGGALQMTRYARNITVATQLARARMALLLQQIEDKKISFGLSKSSCEEGNFGDEGKDFDGFRWEYCIKKVEITIPTDLPGMGTGSGKEGETDKQEQTEQNTQALLSSMGIPTGSTATTDIASSLGPLLGGIQGQMKAVFEQLQESMREIQVIVYWKQDGKNHKLAVTTHLFNFNDNTGMPDGWPEQTGDGEKR